MSQILALYMGSLLIRSIGIAVIAGVCCWKMRNVAVRHAVWLVVLGAMLLMPAFDYLLPADWVPSRMQRIAATQAVAFRAVSVKPADIPDTFAETAPAASVLPVQARGVDWWRIAGATYALVAFAMFLRLVMGYRRIWKLQRTGKKLANALWDEVLATHRSRWRVPVLLESEAVQVPMTIGFFRPAVILPAAWQTWDDWKLRAVLLHEIAHVRRGDWGIAAVAATAKCAYWLNPLSWFLERRLSELAEQASDDASITWTQNTTRYAEILLEFATAAQNNGRFMKRGVAMAHYRIQERIERVLSNPQSGTGFLRIAGWMLVLIVAMPVMYSAAALQVAAERAPASAPTYTAVLGQPLLPQAPPTGQQSRPQSAPVVTIQTSISTSEAELQKQLQWELESQKARQEIEEMRRKLAEVQLQRDLDGQVRLTVPMTGGEPSSQDVILQRLNAQLENLMAQMQVLREQRNQASTPAAVDSIQDQQNMLRELERYLNKLKADAVTFGPAPGREALAYVLKPNDVLSVVVWKQPELSMKVKVQPDGLISVPLVQDLPAAGLTPGQLKLEIEKRLKTHVDMPNVTVILESY